MTTATPAAEDAELDCPLCGYDLRGLPTQRCPECGHAFDPEELRLAKFEKRQWLFEHSRSHLARSWIKTSLATLRPTKFWRGIGAAHTISPRRLGIFATAWMGIAIVLLLVVILMTSTLMRLSLIRQSYVRTPGAWVTADDPAIGWIDVVLTHVAIGRYSANGPPSLMPILALCVWPLAVMLAMRLFSATLRRAEIHSGHLTRIGVYSLPAVLLVPALMALWIEATSADDYILPRGILRSVPGAVWYFFRAVGISSNALLAMVASFLWSGRHLVAAHVNYLRLPHAVAQALLVLTVAWLGLIAALSIISGVVGVY
jgi:hypothetical protein